MTNSQSMLAAVFRAPLDRTTAKVAADAVMEDTECGRFSALRTVARIRRAEKNARELSEAVGYCDYSHPLYQPVMEAIMRNFQNDLLFLEQVLVVSGSRPPTAKARMRRDGRHFMRAVTVTVGARWVLEVVKDIRYMASVFAASTVVFPAMGWLGNVAREAPPVSVDSPNTQQR